MKFNLSFFVGAVALFGISLTAMGQQLSLPPTTLPPSAKTDCMGVSKPDPGFSSLPACEGMPDAVKRPKSSSTRAVWSLVAQQTTNGQTYQVWFDSVTGLIWGDMLDSDYTHLQSMDDFSGDELACRSAEGRRANAGIQTKLF